MRLWMAPLALLSACGFGGSNATPDAHPDAPPPDAQMCFGTYVTTCFNTAADLPTAAKTFSATTNDIDTDSTDASMCNQSHDQKTRFCVIAGAGITIAAGATLRAHGTKPLVLISTMAVDLEGNIDVSSVGSMSTMQGAGANPTGQCTGTTDSVANSGGAGGSFQGRGGLGEPVGTGTASLGAPPSSFPTALRGGCPGRDGRNVAVPGGAGGSGGGAVAIVAPSVMVNGSINASGAGGTGGPSALAAETASGAGGGGSGGMIVIDAPTNGITRGANGLLFANGGGGGEGGGTPGHVGQDGAVSAAPMPAAAGGNSGTGGGKDGGKGGAGSAGGNLGVNGAPSPSNSTAKGGGGGGGGAAGFVHAPGIDGDSIISPPSQNLPGLPA